MQTALIEQMDMPDRDALRFDEHFGLLVDAEYTERENRRPKTRLKRARLFLDLAIAKVDALITDSGIEETHREAFEKLGVRVIVTPNSS